MRAAASRRPDRTAKWASWATALVVGATLPGAAHASDCPPTAVVSGPPALVQELTRALIDRGVRVEPVGLPPGDCAPITVLLRTTSAPGGIAVSISDAWGRTADRKVKDPLTAATLIESWAKMALLDGAAGDAGHTSTVAAAPEPVSSPSPVAAELPAEAVAEAPSPSPTPSAEPVPSTPPPVLQAYHPPQAVPAPKTPLFRLSAEVGLSRDSVKWIGLAGSACFRVGVTCMGVSARYGRSEDQQDAVDAFGVLDVPLRVGPIALTPGIGIGAGWMSARPQAHGLFAFLTPSGDDERVGARVEAHLFASVRLSERLNLEIGGVAQASPRFGRREAMLGDPHHTILRGQAGLLWGLP